MVSLQRMKALSTLLGLLLTAAPSFAQLDYQAMANWAFHPDKAGTLLDGYNLDIAVIDENLQTDTVFEIPNHAMTNTGVDVFFVHPTILSNLWAYTTRENIPLSAQPSFLISASIVGQAGLLSKYGRFFAPRYRQASPPTFIGSPLDSIQAAVIGEAYKDVKAAFLHYLTQHNNGNKIILASHSQGAYLISMLLRDVFDNAPDLRDKLVTAVAAGIVNAYAEPYALTGGWWQHIPLCTTLDECGCLMTWRSFKEGQSLPAPSPALPSLNPFLIDSGYVHRPLAIAQDWVMQDSVYYSDQAAPLRYYLTSKANQPYGGNAGFLAFDSLYQIRFQRDGMAKVGFMVAHTPTPNDQRPNNLLSEESNPLFSSLGYHNRDFNIYQWALLAQIDLKLLACGITTAVDKPISPTRFVRIYPNPVQDVLRVSAERKMVRVELFSTSGTLLKTFHTADKALSLSLKELPKGLYILKVRLDDGFAWTGKLIKN